MLHWRLRSMMGLYRVCAVGDTTGECATASAVLRANVAGSSLLALLLLPLASSLATA